MSNGGACASEAGLQCPRKGGWQHVFAGADMMIVIIRVKT